MCAVMDMLLTHSNPRLGPTKPRASQGHIVILFGGIFYVMLGR